MSDSKQKLAPCPNCRAKINRRSQECPECGVTLRRKVATVPIIEELQTSAPRRRPRNTIGAVVAFLFFGCILLVVVFVSPDLQKSINQIFKPSIAEQQKQIEQEWILLAEEKKLLKELEDMQRRTAKMRELFILSNDKSALASELMKLVDEVEKEYLQPGVGPEEKRMAIDVISEIRRGEALARKKYERGE